MALDPPTLMSRGKTHAQKSFINSAEELRGRAGPTKCQDKPSRLKPQSSTRTGRQTKKRNGKPQKSPDLHRET